MQLYEYLFYNNLSQADFAEKCGLSQPTLSRYITGRSIPDVLNAVAIETASNGEVSCRDWPDLPKFMKERRSSYNVEQINRNMRRKRAEQQQKNAEAKAT